MDTQKTLVNIRVSDGTSMDAVVVQPKTGGPWPGIIYPFESYGLTDQMVACAGKVAAEGFVVIVPDFYHRQGRLLLAPYWEIVVHPEQFQNRTKDQQQEEKPIMARVLMWELRNDAVFDDMDAARDYLKSSPSVRGDRLGVMGSWMGGRIALFYATLRPEIKALVGIGGAGEGSINHWEDYTAYLKLTGGKPPTDPTPAGNKKVTGVVMDHLSKLQAKVLLLATVRGDKRTEVTAVEAALTKLGKPFELHEYPNSRLGFYNPDMPEYYNATYAADAWKRTAAFFNKVLAT